ncbi:uncharacterized protein TRIADDRAFT_56126 [Trichoplax adhaerens]|uniref:Presequence translocated-associated motor subunit PAM17, mitochondrial n=1 Tax=Trichoplax adhaerens TaxID=10228 RepID=B3RX92_TRIAD|nr:hypothetical protein TRIADDRAFT_56126 [Trichoplax adhaerens]EDV24376.1 hypothetical protein TRIADDRAFT_56126 [Trichoplax adhaerens]|eukprot:XP_002112266.1 hypothetical protein TRIADDRAFT_56126 [Trichoplax adhaerens]
MNEKGENKATAPSLNTTAGRFGSKIRPTPLQLPFEEFITFRKKLKVRSRIAGVPFGLLGLTASSMVSAYMLPNMFDTPPDEIQPILGMDPIIFCASAGVLASLCTFVGGSSLYRFFWKISNRELAKNIDEREKDFLQRIEANRVSRSYGTSKYEDDYYGDTIVTLSDYRQWLRKQQQKAQDVTSSDKS